MPDPTLPAFKTTTPFYSSFATDINDTHLIYDYAAENPSTGAPEKWRNKIWFVSSERIVYAIHGGPMAGRKNYQTCAFRCIRPGELWQYNWLEETGTLCSLVYDIKEMTVTTVLEFSRGHWERAEEAYGDKRDERDFKRRRRLARIGSQVERFVLSEQAQIVERFKRRGDLVPIEENAATF